MKANVQNETEQRAANETSQVEFVVPGVDIFETEDGYLLEAEMPGVNKDGLEITLDGSELTIAGHRRPTVPQGEALLSESRQGDYRRTFELDPAIDAAKISARMEQGVLRLTLPKAEQVKPRKISVS